METIDYQKQANDFAEKYGIEMIIGNPIYKKHFDYDKESRYVFPVKLLNAQTGNSYELQFGQSITNRKKKPTFYDIFTCIQKNDVGTFENFCSEFGYNIDSRSAEKIYHSVVWEYKNLLSLLGAETLEAMQEIQ